LMPCRPVFSAATEIREDISSAALEPRRADAGAIACRHRELEATIGFDHRGPGARAALLSDLEVRNLRAVLGRREVLRHLEVRGLEERGHLLERLALAGSDAPELERARHGEVLEP